VTSPVRAAFSDLRQLIDRVLVRRYWSRAFRAGGVRTWAAEPVVRSRLNRRVSGTEEIWPVEWFAGEVVSQPFARALSLGCGEGALERDLMAKGLCREIVGLDLSPEALELARQRAREQGLDGLHYQVVDLDRLQLEAAGYDAVFAHQSLHHVRELETCLDQVSRALRPQGVLYVDEYVGPSRDEWRPELMRQAEAVYRDLPRQVRRRRRLQLPVDRRDPSEAVRSADIIPVIEDRFRILHRRDYGGNLLSVIYPHLRLDSLGDEARDHLLGRILDREEELLAAGAPTFYTVIVAARAE